jgi:hypothetical protein
MAKKMIMVLVIGLFLGACAAGSWAAVHQPHMRAALRALRTAQEELRVATPNKGGHRAKALELVERAIRQTELGIAAGRR